MCVLLYILSCIKVKHVKETVGVGVDGTGVAVGSTVLVGVGFGVLVGVGVGSNLGTGVVVGSTVGVGVGVGVSVGVGVGVGHVPLTLITPRILA